MGTVVEAHHVAVNVSKTLECKFVRKLILCWEYSLCSVEEIQMC